jgi:hydroxymethylpyrimidine/phosphomethylpyrimidine kinase
MKGNTYYRALTIAGSDSGGGAGIQADLKTFSALGCYGMSVITALTAQNTVAVTAIHEIPPKMVSDQINAVLSDIGTDAVKIGMLQTPEVIHAIVLTLKKYDVKNIVVDPVMVAKSGDKLLLNNAVESLKHELLPLAKIITPNIPEAEVLLGSTIINRSQMAEAASALLELGPDAVLLKGGHFTGDTSPDCLAIKSQDICWFEAERIETENTHGTGCTLSSAIAAYLARGFNLEEAVFGGKKYINAAIEAGAKYKTGHGHGPVHHFYKLWIESYNL